MDLEQVNGGVIAYQEIPQDMYLRYVQYLDANPKTVNSYKSSLKQFFMFLRSHEIGCPARDDVIAFRENLRASGHKPTTIQNYIVAVRQFFRWTEQEGIYPNIADHVKGAKIDRAHKKEYMTSNQIRAILREIDIEPLHGKRDYAMIILMTTCGLRTIEVARASIGDIGNVGNNRVLYIQGKGHDEKADYVKISPEVERVLMEYLGKRGELSGDQPLFASVSNRNYGGWLSTRSVSGIVKKRMKMAGYDSHRWTAHSLRHSAVTLALLAGCSLEEVQQFARHTNISTTMIYNHAIDREKNRCGESIVMSIL